MDCERKGCGHPLAVHDPCSVLGCACTAYEPADRKSRAAAITDVQELPEFQRTKAKQQQWIRDVRKTEAARLGGLS